MTAKGPGLEKTGVTVNKWAEFTVDTSKAGKAPLHIAAMDADYNPVDVCSLIVTSMFLSSLKPDITGTCRKIDI